MLIVGIDCATDPKKTGLALGSYERGACRLLEARAGSKSNVEIVAAWMARSSQVLLALDAPLGWPQVTDG